MGVSGLDGTNIMERPKDLTKAMKWLPAHSLMSGIEKLLENMPNPVYSDDIPLKLPILDTYKTFIDQ